MTFEVSLSRSAKRSDDESSKEPAYGEVDLQDAAQPVEPSPEPTNYHKGLLAFDSGDYATAAHKWLISASHGDLTSQFRLAQLYEQGLGVPQDFVQAHRWYNIAGSQGHTEARKARDALGSRMTANQLAEAQRLATETSLLPQFGLNQPAIPSVDQESAHAPRDISRFDGRWKAGAKLHYSSPKGRCGNQVVTIRILDGQVSGNIRLAVSFYKDSAAGAYPFSGTIDQEGNLQAKGQGLSLTGVISDEIFTIRGVWKLSSAGCRGTYDGEKEYGGQDL